MEFDPARVAEFEALFAASSPLIRQFEGVGRLELHRDAALPHVFYTLSEWESEAHLEAYRKSELFESIWSRTKVLFSGKPTAFSLHKVMSVE